MKGGVSLLHGGQEIRREYLAVESRHQTNPVILSKTQNIEEYKYQSSSLQHRG